MNTHTKEGKRSVGKPRNESSKAAIISSTIKLLEHSSFANLTIEGIAKDAGASKATIYRWWKNKEELLLSIYLDVTDLSVKFNPLLSVEENFRQVIIELSRVLDSTLGRALISAIVENEDLLKKFHVHFFEPRRLEAKSILEMGIHAGIIQSEIDLDISLDMLFSPIYLKIFMYRENIDTNFVNGLIRHFMNGIATR